MKVSLKIIVAALLASYQSTVSVEAFTTTSPCTRPITVASSLRLRYKNEFMPEIENEVLVSNEQGNSYNEGKRKKKKCCKGCSGCRFATAARNTEPDVLKEATAHGANEGTTMIETNYTDAFAGEGLPLFG